MSPIFSLLRTAAKSEPEIAALLERLLAERLQGMMFLIEQLERTHGLRAGLDRQQAGETVWALSSAEVFHLLTVERGWPREKYSAWLADSLARLLLIKRLIRSSETFTRVEKIIQDLYLALFQSQLSQLNA